MQPRFAVIVGVCLALLASALVPVAAAGGCTLRPGDTAYEAVLEDPSARFVDAGTSTAHLALGSRRSCVTRTIATGSGYVTARAGTIAYVLGGGTSDSRISVVRRRMHREIPLDGADRQFTPVVGPSGAVAYLDYTGSTSEMRLRVASGDGRRMTVAGVVGSTGFAPSYSAPTWLPDGRLAVLVRSGGPASLTRLQLFRETVLVSDRAVPRPFANAVLAMDDNRVVLSDYVGAPAERSIVLNLSSDTMNLLPADSRPLAWNGRRSTLLAVAADGTLHWLVGTSFATKIPIAAVTGRRVVGGSHTVP